MFKLHYIFSTPRNAQPYYLYQYFLGLFQNYYISILTELNSNQSLNLYCHLYTYKIKVMIPYYGPSDQTVWQYQSRNSNNQQAWYQRGLHQHLIGQSQSRDHYGVGHASNIISLNELNYWNFQNTQNFTIDPRRVQPYSPYSSPIQQNYHLQPRHNSFPTQDIFPPPLDYPDPFIHYQFLSSLKQTHHYTESSQIPHHLINYFLNYLSLENCPYSKTALSYIVTNIRDFTQILAQHQIEFLIKIIRRKYPSNVEYYKQYEKLIHMDEGQAEKLVQLLEILCIIFCQFEGWRLKGICKQQNKEDNDQNEYLHWVINYTLVLFRHIQHLENISNRQGSIEKTNKLLESLQNNKNQLLQLLKQEKLKNNQAILPQISKITYKSISKECIMSDIRIQAKHESENNQCQLIRSFIEIFMDICHQNNMDASVVLFQQMKGYLCEDMGLISTKIGKITDSICENQQIRSLFSIFSLKVFNLLILGPWTKMQKLQFIQMLASCRLLCQLNHEGKQGDSQYAQIIKQAFEISRHSHSFHKKPNVKFQRQSHDLDLSDDW